VGGVGCFGFFLWVVWVQVVRIHGCRLQGEGGGTLWSKKFVHKRTTDKGWNASTTDGIARRGKTDLLSKEEVFRQGCYVGKREECAPPKRVLKLNRRTLVGSRKKGTP